MNLFKSLLRFAYACHKDELGGFNPRLAPFTVQQRVVYHPDTDNNTHDHDAFFYRFPYAGQLIGAYACLAQDAASQAGDDKTTNLFEVSIWKNSADNTTGTYATADRAAARTGEAANTTGALIWLSNRVYTLTNKTATRRKFDAGDKLFLRTRMKANTDHPFAPPQMIDVQMDYIIGHES